MLNIVIHKLYNLYTHYSISLQYSGSCELMQGRLITLKRSLGYDTGAGMSVSVAPGFISSVEESGCTDHPIGGPVEVVGG